MKRAYGMPAALDSAVAVKRVSERASEVQFDFSGPAWAFLAHHLRTAAHPAWFNIITFVGIFRGLRAVDDIATALAVCRWSCERCVGSATPVECSRVLVVPGEAQEEQWIACSATVANAQGRVWAKCEMRAKVLGSMADFAKRRAMAKARVDPRECREGRLIAPELVRGVTTFPMIGQLQEGCSLFVVSRRVAMEEHPYYEGSGDHVNTQMLSDLFLQFGAAVCRAMLGVAADFFVTVASSMHMLRYVEFDMETVLELTGTGSARCSEKPFAETSAFEVAREWNDVASELRVIKAQLTQQDKVCARFESVLLPLLTPKL